jgi:hypothetical protein
MKTTIFGGRTTDSFQDYLASLRRAIAVQLEKQIESGETEENSKTEVKKMFLIDNLKFEISNGEIVDTHSENYENVPTSGGGTRKVYLKRYSYTIPFYGDSEILKFKPQTYHGSARTAEVSSNYSTNQNKLTVIFKCEMNNQAQFDHFKSDSLGELSSNCNEINREIDLWNNKQLDEVIASLYPNILAHVNETKEFEKRNGIK